MDRQVCSKEHPMPFHSKYKWVHPDAIAPVTTAVGEVFTCPNCGHSFERDYNDRP
jgi:transposase